MLRSITLSNYKSFKHETTIDVKSLTLLCGVNSSGKSSIMKSLLMLKQSFQNHNNRGEITYNDKYVNNGDFNSIAFNTSEPVVLSDDFLIMSDSFRDRDIYKELYRTLTGDNVKTQQLMRKNAYRNNPFEISFTIEIKNKRINKYSIVITYPLLSCPIIVTMNRDKERESIFYVNIKNLVINNTSYSSINNETINTVCYFEGISVTNMYANDPPKNVDIQPILSFIISLLKSISTQYQYSIEHIAPLRNSPSRLYIANSSYSTVGISGENAIQLLNEMENESALNFLAPQSDILEFNKSKHPIKAIVESWLNYIEMGNYDIKIDEEIIRMYIGKQSIADVGFGVSQILPIIVEGAIMKQYQTLLLEQPEIHLHPKAQMKIADYLLSLAVCKKNVIVETHSDHIINRIVRRCLENPELIDMISILFLSKDKDGITRIEPIHIDEHLGIDRAPLDFFDQYAAETDMIIQKGYANMLRDSKKND